MATDILTPILSGGLNLVVFILIAVFAIAAGVGIYFYFKKRNKYKEFLCVIFCKTGSQDFSDVLYDKAGIFTDGKTGNKRFYLKDANVGLAPDDIPYYRDGKRKIVFLVKNGLKNFSFLKLKFSPNVSLEVTEEDVNWAINAYEREKKKFDTSLLMQLMPYIVIFFTSLIIMIIFLYFFKRIDVMSDAASALRDAAMALERANAGTTIIPS